MVNQHRIPPKIHSETGYPASKHSLRIDFQNWDFSGVKTRTHTLLREIIARRHERS